MRIKVESLCKLRALDGELKEPSTRPKLVLTMMAVLVEGSKEGSCITTLEERDNIISLIIFVVVGSWEAEGSTEVRELSRRVSVGRGGRASTKAAIVFDASLMLKDCVILPM